ncbi:MAG: efflux RND transporter periplasmic adaptor subunit [Acidobacteriia bacterium]|nr:efflux RND transporter periplasmic adaptor subunit [Terriglobia bacterium]
MKSKKPIAILIGLVIVVAAGIWFYRSTTASVVVSEKDLVTVPRVDFPQIVVSSGLLEARSSQAVTPPLVGDTRSFKLVRMVDEGSQVSEGDFLLEFDGADFSRRLRDAQTSFQRYQETYQQNRSRYDSQVRDNKLNLDQSKADLENLKLKLSQQAELESALTIAITKLQRDMKQTQVDMLERKIKYMDESARLDMQIARSSEAHTKKQMEDLLDTMDSLTVRAPVAGVVIYKRDFNNEPPALGSNVTPMNPVLEIPDLSTMRVKVLVDEIDAGKVRIGQKARITVPALQGLAFDGKVIDMSAILKQASYDRAQKIAEARVELDPGQDLSLLRPGMSANVQIQVGIISQALAIPLGCIQERNGGSYVQVYDPVKKDFQWRQIELQANDEELAVVRAGLGEKEQIRSKPKI